MIIITIIMFILCLFLYDVYLHHKKSGRLLDLIPGPPHIPIFGSVFLIFRSSYEDVWHFIRYVTSISYITKIWFGPVCVVSLRHPDDLKTVLSTIKHVEKSKLYDFLRPVVDDGLITSRGSKWHTRRKILTPAFHFNVLEQFSHIFIEESNRMIRSLKTEDTIIKELTSFVSEHTLNALCETMMETSLDSFDTLKTQYRKLLLEITQIVPYRVMNPWLHLDWVFAVTPSGRKQAKLIKILHGFTEKVIKERKLYHERTNNRYFKDIESNRTETEDVEMIKSQKRLPLIDLLIAASRENRMTDLDIREEIDTFMAAGYDTTTNGLCFILLVLAEYEDIQNRVRKEIDDVMKESKGKFSMTSLQKLSYLERCLKEALRLYPSIPQILRSISEDIKCQSYTVPANTIVHINIYDVHRDPNFWSNPNVFDPDRFLPDKIQNRHPYCYLPFSAGPRNCIGQRFALLEMKAMVASLVHNFYIQPVDSLKNLQFKMDVTLQSANPLRVKFVPIK